MIEAIMLWLQGKTVYKGSVTGHLHISPANRTFIGVWEWTFIENMI